MRLQQTLSPSGPPPSHCGQSLCAGLISLNVMSSGSTCYGSITQSMSIVYVTDLCFVCSSVDLHLVYWELPPRKGVPGYHCGTLTSFPLDVISRRFTAGACGSSSFTFLGHLYPGSHSGALIYIPSSSV